MDKTEYYNCTTICMGKYLDGNSRECYDLEIETATHFAKAFALWMEEDCFDRKTGYFSVKITYVNDNFFNEDTLAAIKFFMQLHGYSYMYSNDGQRTVYDDNE